MLAEIEQKQGSRNTDDGTRKPRSPTPSEQSHPLSKCANEDGMTTSAKNSGIINIHGKPYQTVALRVSTFRESHPDWTIYTELVSRDDTTVVMKASIADPEQRVIGTGYAEENRSSSQINRTSALENCETSAIGRALAACGYGGTEYASANEVENAIHQQKRSTSVRAMVLDGAQIDGQSLDQPESAIREAMRIWNQSRDDQEAIKNAKDTIMDAVRGLDQEHIVALYDRFDAKQRKALNTLVDWKNLG